MTSGKLPFKPTVGTHFQEPEWVKLEQDIYKVWNYIYSDVINSAEDNETCVETCIDADRLTVMVDAKDSDTYLKRLVGTYGYEKVLHALSSQVTLF